MDFLKKAKAQMKELENDLNKATHALGLGDRSDNSSSAPSGATPATSTSGGGGGGAVSAAAPDTPKGDCVTTIPPGTEQSGKMPMTLRKNIRDEWDNKKDELEANLEKVMKTKWHMCPDPPHLYTYATNDSGAKESLGYIIKEVYQSAGIRLADFVKQQGDPGRESLNKLVYHHTITWEPSPDVKYCGCDIRDGKLRMLFNPKEMATNASGALNDLGKAMSIAETSGSHGQVVLPFTTRANIRSNWEAKVPELLEKTNKNLKTDKITYNPNFEANYAAVLAYEQSNPDEAEDELSKNWKEAFGSFTYEYFHIFTTNIDWKNFRKDEMLREGWFDAVTSNEVALRVVPKSKLTTSSRCECVIEDGVFYMQCQPSRWGHNISEASSNILKIL